MAIFQPRPFQVPSLTTNYAAENQAVQGLADWASNLIPNMRKQALEGQKQQLLGQLAGGNGDLAKVGLGLLATGNVTEGAAVLGLAQKQQQLGAQKGISDLFSGGGGGASPSTSSAGPASLIQNESGGNWGATNNAVGAGGAVGHFGRAQFGQARIQDAVNAGALPPGTTPQQFTASPELQKRAEAWHFGDIDNFIQANGYDKLVGQQINGVPITIDGMRSVAHLGGTGGLRKFIESGGAINPSDRNGTSLMDYFTRHAGNSTPLAPRQQIANPIAQPGVQVAETEADVQRLEAQQAQRPVQVAQAPAQPGAPVADAPAPGAAAAQFAVPGSLIPPNDPLPRVSNQQLMGIVANPNATDGQRSIANTVLANRLKYSDENAPDKREMTRLQTEKLRQEVGGEQYKDLVTPEERAAAGVDPNYKGPVQRNRSGQISFPGKASTEVNVNSGEKTYDQAVGKANAEYFVDTQKGGRDARDQITTLKRMQSVMSSPDFYSGWSGGRATAFKKLAVSLGIKDAESAAPNELFDKLSKQAVLDKAGGSFGTGFSNGDREYIDASTANLENTPEGNRRIIEMGIKVAERRIEVARMAREYAKGNGGRLDSGFDEQVADYAEKNPLFQQVQQPQAQAAPAQAPAPSLSAPTATGPNGQRLMWDGKAWVPFS